jgi:hypothetical protein
VSQATVGLILMIVGIAGMVLSLMLLAITSRRGGAPHAPDERRTRRRPPRT